MGGHEEPFRGRKWFCGCAVLDGASYDVWADTVYNLSDIDDRFGGLMSVVRFAASLLVYLALIRYLINTYHRIFGEGE